MKINKLSIILLMTIFIIVICSMCKSVKEASSTSSGSPQSSASVQLTESDIAFKETVNDDPTVFEGENIEHIYVFTNSGSETLKVINAKAGCGCTVASYTKDDIKPGDSGDVKVTLNTSNRLGNQQKSVTIETNSKKNPNVSLTIKGTVNPVIDSPKTVTFEQISRKGTFTKDFIIKTNEKAELPFKVLSAKSSNEYVKVNFVTLVENKEFKIIVTLDALLATKTEQDKHEKIREKNTNYTVPEDFVFNGNNTIETDQPKKKLIYVNYNGTLAKNPKTPEELKVEKDKKEKEIENK